MANDESLLAKIRALLAKAERTTNPHEAEAYNTKVAELVAKYGIDQALLAEKVPELNIPGDKRITVQGPYLQGKVELICWVASALRCRTVKRSWGSRTELEVHVFGIQSDLERFEILYTSLLLQASSGLQRVEVPYWEHARTFRNAWLRGFSAAVVARLRKAEALAEQNARQTAAEAGTPGVALVLADRKALVDRRVEELYPDLGKPTKRKVKGSREAFNSGVAAGNRADLGHDRLATNRRALSS